MRLSELIAKHIKYDFPLAECSVQCAVCRKKIVQGVPKKKIIKSSFTDYEYLKHISDYLCPQCCALIGQVTVNGKKTWLRNFSFIASDSEFKVLKRENILKNILNPPDPPFVFCVTYTNKKQVAIKASVQFSSEIFTVHTDKGSAEVRPAAIKELLKVITGWYTVVPEKSHLKIKPTYFTKQEIKSGSDNMHKIKQYGVEKYWKENVFLEKYRNTGLLNLLVFSLNVQG